MSDSSETRFTASDGVSVSVGVYSGADLPWVARCESHGVSQNCATKRLARNMLKAVNRVTWCPQCCEMHGTRFLKQR
jgi:hypothetical protein